MWRWLKTTEARAKATPKIDQRRSPAKTNPGPAPAEDRLARPWQDAARVLLPAILLALGLYLLSNYLRALVWAVVLAIALWPLFERARLRVPRRMRGEVLPALFTLLVGFVFVLPFAILAIEAVRELHDLVDFGRQAEQSGIPLPGFVAHLPFGSQQIGTWWTTNLAHAGWAKDALHGVNTESNRELGRNVGADALHRVILFGFAMLALFFLFRDGEAIRSQCLVASDKLFGPRGERVARQMVASVHGTVNGLVLVGIGEGVLLGVVYFFAGVPHPILFGAVTAVAAMIPFAAAIAFCLAALVLVGSGGIVPAAIVVVAGFLVTFTADHFVRPKLIGGATKLPFLWVLLGILGGVETFRLLGLFLGPAIMAALMLLWRDLTETRPET
jgi:predicted PurR-regulated permease PerM